MAKWSFHFELSFWLKAFANKCGLANQCQTNKKFIDEFKYSCDYDMKLRLND